MYLYIEETRVHNTDINETRLDSVTKLVLLFRTVNIYVEVFRPLQHSKQTNTNFSKLWIG